MTAPERTPDCLLTLTLPVHLEEEVLDTLLAHPDLASGFTVLPAQGLGTQVTLTTTLEQVQGRARRVQVQVALSQQVLPTLLGHLRDVIGSPQITYWVTPLMMFGHLQ